MTTLYDDLGVAPDASYSDVRRAYRELARRLHPDLNAAPDSEERMRRINRAWTTLSDPDARARYDLTLRPVPEAVTNTEPWPEPPPRGMRWLRPSVLVIAVLTIIFIATAYAGPGGPSKPRSGPTGATTTTDNRPVSGLVNSAMVGQCLLVQAGYDAIVPCTQHNDGLVIGQTTHSADCPPGTAVHQLAGRNQFVCLAGVVTQP